MEFPHDFSASVDLAGLGQEDRLPDHRSARVFSGERGVESLQGVFGLFGKAAAPLGSHRGKQVPDTAQVDSRQIKCPVGRPGDGMRGHSNPFHETKRGQWQEAAVVSSPLLARVPASLPSKERQPQTAIPRT